MKNYLLLIVALALAMMFTSCAELLDPIWPSFNPPEFTTPTTDKEEEEKPLVPAVGLEYVLLTDSDGAEYYAVAGRGTCEDEHILIPDEHEGKPIREIADEAFLNDTSLKAIHFSKSITKIGNLAFAGSALTELVIPDNVTEVGGMVIAFAPVERLVIGNGMTAENLINLPFACSTALKEIVVSDDNTACYVEDGVLYANAEESEGSFLKVLIQYPTASEETSFTVPSDVYGIWSFAFSCANNLEEITIPSTVIPYQCFFWSDSLTKINFNIVLDDVLDTNTFLYTFTDYFVKGETIEPSINGVSNYSIPNYTLVYDGGEITKEGIDALVEDMISE